MNIKPLADRVLVKPIAAEEKTASGIIIPDSAKEKPLKGEVLAVGKGSMSRLQVSGFHPRPPLNLHLPESQRSPAS